jgi:GxxExxY protein
MIRSVFCLMEKFLKNIAKNIFNELGPCHLENVYQRAFMVELDEKEMPYSHEVNIPVYYKKNIVGVIRADIIIDGKWVIELKACPSIKPEHVLQTLHYMERIKALEGYVINFPNKPGAEGPEIKKILATPS